MATATVNPASVADQLDGDLAWTTPDNAIGADTVYASAQQTASANHSTNKLRYNFKAAMDAIPLLRTGAIRNVTVTPKRSATWGGGGQADASTIRCAFLRNQSSPAALTEWNRQFLVGVTGTVNNTDVALDDNVPWTQRSILEAYAADLFGIDIYCKNPASSIKQLLYKFDDLVIGFDYEPGPISAPAVYTLKPTAVTVVGDAWSGAAGLVGVTSGAAATCTVSKASPATTLQCTFDASAIPAGFTIVECRIRVRGFIYEVTVENNGTFANPCSLTATLKTGASLAVSVNSPESWTSKYHASNTGLLQPLNGNSRNFSLSGGNLPTLANLKAGCRADIVLASTMDDAGGATFDTARWTADAVTLFVRGIPVGLRNMRRMAARIACELGEPPDPATMAESLITGELPGRDVFPGPGPLNPTKPSINGS